MKIQRNRQHYETIEPSKKKMLLDKQQIRVIIQQTNMIKTEKVKKYKTMNCAQKKNDQLNKKAEKYKIMDVAKKQDLLHKQAEKDKIVDTGKKQDLLNKQAQKYKTMDPLRKQELLERCKET